MTIEQILIKEIFKVVYTFANFKTQNLTVLTKENELIYTNKIFFNEKKELLLINVFKFS